MRIIHTSDWHVGRSLHGADLSAAHAQFFDFLCELVDQEQPDALLVAGDIFDRAIAPVEAVALVDDALARLCARTRVLLTPGNHDSAGRLAFGQGLLTERLVMRARVTDVGRAVALPNGAGQVGALIYPLPYLDPDWARLQLAGSDPQAASEDRRQAADDAQTGTLARSHAAVLQAAHRRIAAAHARQLATHPHWAGLPVVVSAHAFVVGGRTSDSERDIRVGGVDFAPLEALSPATGWAPDYLALGHLHRPQWVGPARPPGGQLARYSGSPLAFSFSEWQDTKSVSLVELGERGGAVRLTAVPTPVWRQLAVLRGPLAELLSPAHAAHRSAFVSVEVTDAARPRELVGRVREVFPHALVVRHAPPALPTPQAASSVAPGPGRDPVQVVAGFLAEVGGRPATTVELAEVRASYEAVR
ncbi:exonuclease SbcCD subunit D [Buchananella hordeovulneris]|uniref:exonuclease SbcCD subunit D n=1 Tax=Buchananella hordeovulneris TaxID=52770 RepID=UPI000F5DF1D6|nr:exonuclease SbcCD subunit D C-terminal domain-containing protein [Buchananella hordeovulneris]RRD43172.1 exonuclease subunit SbcD [Buchananella hordeovulneris]